MKNYTYDALSFKLFLRVAMVNVIGQLTVHKHIKMSQLELYCKEPIKNQYITFFKKIRAGDYSLLFRLCLCYRIINLIIVNVNEKN